jgi:hypothetical protein
LALNSLLEIRKPRSPVVAGVSGGRGMSEQEIFLVESPGWVKPIIVGVLTLIINSFIGWKLYYIHFYLFAAGGVTYLLSLSKYASLNRNELILYYGIILFQKPIPIKWDRIRDIETHYVNRRDIAINRVAPVPVDYKKDALRITLNTAIAADLHKSIQKYNRMRIFSEGIKISDNASEILLLDRPKSGFHPLIETLSKHTKVIGFARTLEYNRLEKAVISLFGVIGPTIIVFVVLWFLNSMKLR